jgi:ubiquinone/menaquinone biosynthesis C-methylase UbiE
MEPIKYKTAPSNFLKGYNRQIADFTSLNSSNIDTEVVNSFGDEWLKFNSFSDAEITRTGNDYFSIVDNKIVNKNSYGIDLGCGTGRWTKYFLDRIGFMEAVDPSNAILSADRLLDGKKNVRLTKAAIDNLPFEDNTFDFAMSVGVLHHIPDTKKALADCVKKLKPGGYMYVYLYYSLDNRGLLFKSLFKIVNAIRIVVSSLPKAIKKFCCDIIAYILYLPIILIGRLLRLLSFKKLAARLPLSGYHDQSFYIIRNDALDRFGTKLEHRFSRKEIMEMMLSAGLEEIVIPDKFPYWHAIGRKKKS